MILGFTGTRNGMTPAQRKALRRIIARLSVQRHLNGACHGADREAVDCVRALCSGVVIELLPGDEEQREWARAYAAKVPDTIVHAVRDYLIRNRMIVSRSTSMIATPREANEQPRGGTWSTIRYAKERKRPLTIIRPDGTSVYFGPPGSQLQ